MQLEALQTSWKMIVERAGEGQCGMEEAAVGSMKEINWQVLRVIEY